MVINVIMMLMRMVNNGTAITREEIIIVNIFPDVIILDYTGRISPSYIFQSLSLCLPICLSVYRSICLSVSLCLYLSIYLCIDLYLYICLTTYLSIYLFIYLSSSFYPSICYLHIFIHPYVYLSIYLHPFIYLSVYLSPL